MRMVIEAVDGERHDPDVPANTGHIAPQFRLNFPGNYRAPVFGAENYVKMVSDERVRQMFVPPVR